MTQTIRCTRAGLRYVEGLRSENRRLAEELELAKLREKLLWEQLNALRETVALFKTGAQLGSLINACDTHELQAKRTRPAAAD